MERVGLISVWEHHPIDYTHIHTDLSSTSSLDHFIVNERLLPLVLDAGPMHLGDNLSRHSPILLKLDLGSIPARKLTKSVNLRKPAWYKADQECRDQYTNCLYEKLSSLQLPESLLCSDPHCQNDTHSLERDNLVIDMMSQVIESSHQYIPTSSGKSSRKHSDSPIDKSIPGWKDIVKPYKDEAKFWYGVWQSADRPNQGVLKNIMTKTRNQYHYAIRRIKKMSNTLRAKRLLEASEVDSYQLLIEMKKIRGSKKGDVDLPDVLVKPLENSRL